MKFTIKNRWSGKVQFECELDAEIADKSYSLKLGFAVSRAVDAGADLADADLADANLAGANLAGADLAGADLADANLAGAKNIPEDAGKELTPADYAQRAAEYRARNPDVPAVEALDRKVLEIIEAGMGKLDMSAWHTCETTHCRAGWAIHLAGEAGRKLERLHGPETAGRMIYRASIGRVPWFYDTDAGALADLKARAAEQA